MKLVPYEAQHAIDLILREVEEPLRKYADFEDWAKLNEGPFALSAIHDNKVIACGGIREMWEGVGEAWLFLGVEAMRHRVGVCRAMKEKLDEALGQFHRIQAHARMDFSVAHMFLNKLGFVTEGYMTAYYPDKMDAILYSLVRK